MSWIVGSKVQQEKTEKKFKAQVYYNQKCLTKTFYGWSKYQLYKQRVSEYIFKNYQFSKLLEFSQFTK